MTNLSKQTCSIEGCERPRVSYGLCNMHRRRKVHGYKTKPIPDLPGEEWRPVIGHEAHYLVSNHGRIKSLERNITMKNGVTRMFRGKLLNPRYGKRTGTYTLVEIENKRVVTLHSLIAEAFLGPRPTGYQVNHKNGDKSDNRVVNLEYVTPSQNSLHAYRTGLARPRCLLNEELVRYIRRMKGRKTYQELADEIGCSMSTVCHVITGRTWKHVD